MKRKDNLWNGRKYSQRCDWKELNFFQNMLLLPMKLFSSVSQLCPTLCDPMNHSTPGLSVHHQFVVVHPNPCPLSRWSIQPSHPLLSTSPPALNLPSIRVSSNESALCIRWPKDWSFCFSISPSSEYSGLISLRIDWFDLLTIQGSLKSLLQQHSLKASILWHPAFFMVQLSYPYMTIGKTIALTRRTLVGR